MNEWNESSESNEPNRPTPRTGRPNTRTVTATLPFMRREPGRPELTLIEGGLSAEAVERAVTQRGPRWPHPAGSKLEPADADEGDGPVAG